MRTTRSVDYVLAFRVLPARSVDFDVPLPAEPSRSLGTRLDFRTLLADILASELDRLGSRRILLPVTSGLDSRGLLGAALDILPPEAVQTFTVGEPANPEVVGGSRAAERAGVPWENIDPRTFSWETDRVHEVVRKSSSRLGPESPLMNPWAMFMDYAVRRPDRGGAMLLSGFFGGAIAGGTLRPREVRSLEPRGTVAERFVRSARRSSYESRIGVDLEEPRLREYFEEWLSQFPAPEALGRGATSFDLLNWHFRMTRLLLPAVSGTAPLWSAPYMSARWMSYWFWQARSQRFNRSMYRRELRRAYPNIFPDLQEPASRARYSLRERVIARARRVTGRRPAGHDDRVTDLLLSEMGDPRANPSLRAHLQTCCEAFDSRKLYRWLACDDLEVLLKEPTYGALVRAHSIAMLEMNLQAGTLSPGDEPKF